MENNYYILSEENDWFPIGCIFETTENQKLFCIDNERVCENVDKVFEKCIKINRKSAILLQSVPLINRIHLLKNKSWPSLSQLDVGDECFYILNGQNIPCEIISKELGKNGISFNILTNSAEKFNIKIDRLLIKENLTSKHVQELTIESTTRCKCLCNIFQKAHSLELTLKDKEVLFRNLFNILPESPDDDNKRSSLHWGCHYLVYSSLDNLMNLDDDKNKQDRDGNVPLILAITSPLAEFKNYKENLEKVVLTLFKNGADINIRNNLAETPLTKVVKNGNFNLLKFMLENYEKQFLLSDHLLSNEISILELLIKLNMHNLASLCCKRSRKEESENIYFIKSSYLALISGMKDLSLEILEKSTDVNETMNSRDTFLTLILTDKNINSENICFLLNTISFDFNKCNKKEEYPLLLSCRRLMLDVIKIIFNKSINEIPKINEALEETITAYNEYYINVNYKQSKVNEFQSIAQIKQNAVGIIDLLLKNGANIEITENSNLTSIENCVDNDFVKIVKHICRKTSIKPRDSTDSKGSPRQTIETVNECSICMARAINCVFLCGHTCCFECGDKLFECHACRLPITERRKIFIS